MAKNTIKLDNPIKVNGVECAELTYDHMKITNDLYLEACMKSSAIGNTMNAAVMRELNEALAFCLGKAAIIADNPKISWNDLDQLMGFDLLDVTNIGRFFITRKRGASDLKASAVQSEDIPSGSTQAQQN